MTPPTLLSRLLPRLSAPLLLIAALSACGPIYDTQYFFTPPNDSSGRQMVGQCRMTRDMCKQNCEMREMACKSDARSAAMREYHYYVEQRRRQNAPLKQSPESFVRDSHCYSGGCESNCESGYRSCYVESGGRIRTKQVCVAFCDQEKPQNSPSAQNKDINPSDNQAQSQAKPASKSKPKVKPEDIEDVETE